MMRLCSGTLKKLPVFCLASLLLSPAAVQAQGTGLTVKPPTVKPRTKKEEELVRWLKIRSQKMRDCDAAGGQLIGLSSSELVEKCGQPDDTRTTTTARGTSQVMIYGSRFWAYNSSGRVTFYVHLEDDRVVAFQN